MGGTNKKVKWIDKFLPSTIHINVEVIDFQPLKFHFFLCVFVFELWSYIVLCVVQGSFRVLERFVLLPQIPRYLLLSLSSTSFNFFLLQVVCECICMCCVQPLTKGFLDIWNLVINFVVGSLFIDFACSIQCNLQVCVHIL